MAELTRSRLDKQIQKAPKINQFPLSDANGELQYADILATIKAGETLTRLNSVDVVAGNLVIKYTAEDGVQQVVSTPLAINQQDIKVSDAKLDNPSAGVYRLLITENDGTTYPVDLSALLAVVTQNAGYVTLSGNGTPQSPLRADLSDLFFQQIPKALDDLGDTTVNQALIDDQLTRNGDVALVWNTEMRQWMPRSISGLDKLKEITETFRDLRQGNTVALQIPLNGIADQSLKVYRNGMRQDNGVDYTANAQQGGNLINFSEPFTDKYPEKVTVDYRPIAA